MIQVKLGELPQILEGLNSISQIDLPIKAAYWVGKNMKKVVAEYQDFEKSRVALAEKYAEKDEQGKPVIRDQVYIMAEPEMYRKEFTELSGIVAEFDFLPLNLEQFGDINIKPDIIFNLGPFVQDGGC